LVWRHARSNARALQCNHHNALKCAIAIESAPFYKIVKSPKFGSDPTQKTHAACTSDAWKTLPPLAQHACELLESAGHTVSVFNNGEDMIKAVDRDTINLYVLDCECLEFQGLKCLNTYAQLEHWKNQFYFWQAERTSKTLQKRSIQVQMITVQKEASAQENRFCIASFNGASDVIEVSVRHLIDVYTGVPVRVGGMPFSACFLVGTMSLPRLP
jgi:CheY-like chemotaxis protein